MKPNAKEALERIRGLNEIIEAELQDIALWKHKAEGLKSIEIKERVMTSPETKDSMADAVATYVDLEEALDKTIKERWEERQKLKADIYKALLAGCISDSEFQLLNGYYIQGKEFDVLADELYISQSGITSKHYRAVKGFQEYLLETFGDNSGHTETSK